MNNHKLHFPAVDDPMRSSALTPGLARQLLERVTPPVVTLTLPLDPTQQNGQHARLTLKNLLADARGQLASWPEVDAGSLLADAHALLDDDQWWRGPGRGFIAVMAPGVVFECFRSTEPLASAVMVDNQLAIRALLPAVHADERFFVLSISQNHVQLYAGDRYGLTPSAVELSPNSLADAMRLFEHSNDLNRHGGGRIGTGRPVEQVHGQGSARDSRKSELHEYFRGVDEAVCDVIGDGSDTPLVLAIGAPQFSIYREVTKYRNLSEDIVAGNADHLQVRELHQQAWALLAPHFEQDRERAIARYRDSIGTARFSTSTADIVSGSAEGRIATIFVGSDRPVWGHVDSETGLVTINSKRRPEDEDLVNRSVAQTLLHGGMAYGQVDLGAHTMAVLYRH